MFRAPSPRPSPRPSPQSRTSPRTSPSRAQTAYSLDEGISRPDVASAVAAAEPPVARPLPPPPPEGGRVTRSQTRAGIAGLVAPLERDRPHRAPVSPIQRAKARWTDLVDSGRVDALYNNDWGCVVNTIPRGLQAQWIEVLTTTLQWISDEENGRRRAAAWWLFRAIAPMILRKGAGMRAPPELRFPIRARLEAFIRGDWEELWEDLEAFAAEDKRLREAKANPTAAARPCSHKRVAALCSMGQLSNAFDRLTAVPSAPRNDATLAKLQELHPPEPDTVPDPPMVGPRFPFLARSDWGGDPPFSVSDVKRDILRSKPGKSQDRFGFRIEFLKPIARRHPAVLELYYRHLLDTLSGGKVPASIALSAGGARLAAVTKKGAAEQGREKIRPIGVTDIHRRIIGKCLSHSAADALRAHFAGGAGGRVCQLAVSQSRGTQINFVGVSEHLRLHPHHISLQGDVKNAFQTVGISAVLEGLRHFDPDDENWLARFMYTYYMSGGDALSYFLANGDRAVVTRRTGVTQGCPLGTTLFCLATHRLIVQAVEEVAGDSQEIVHFAFADDGHLCGPADLVFAVAAKIETKLGAVGLFFRDWAVVWGPRAPDPEYIATLADGAMGSRERVRILHRPVDTGSPSRGARESGVAEEGLRLVGGPFGNASYAEEHVCRLVDEHIAKLGELVSFGETFPQHAYLLLRFCATFRTHHLYAMVPWEIAGDHYVREHGCILQTFRQIVDLPDANDVVWDQRVLDRLALPQCEGGFALTDPKRVADIALVANWCACASFLAKTVPSLRNIGGPLSASEPVSPSSGPLWGGVVSAFDRVRKALVDGRDHEAGVLEEAEARFSAAETRGSGHVPIRVKDALHRAKARLKVAERSLLLLDPDFDRIPQGGDYSGLQRALSKLAHARARVALHAALHASADRDEAPGTNLLRAQAASLLAAAAPGAMAWLHHSPCHRVGALSSSEFRAAVRLTLCLDFPEIARAVAAGAECSCCNGRFTTPASFAAHALCSKFRRPDGGGSVYAVHNALAYTLQEFARYAGIASFMGGGMCRAGTGSDGHPIHADIAFEGLSSGAIVGDRELGDVSLRNLVGSNLVTMHHADVDPYGVINAGVADKNKKYAKAIADHEIDGCMALVVNAGGGVSKDLSKLIYRLARKRTERVLGPPPAVGDNENDAALLQEHKMHTADEVRRMRGAFQTVRIRGQVNLILRAPKVAAVARQAVQVHRRAQR